jgi:hypothetical protein
VVSGFIWARCAVGWGEPANGQKSRWRNGVVPTTVPRTWPCRARVVSCRVMGQAGGPYTALAFVPCRHGHAALCAVPPIGRAVPPCSGPWAVWKYIPDPKSASESDSNIAGVTLWSPTDPKPSLRTVPEEMQRSSYNGPAIVVCAV